MAFLVAKTVKNLPAVQETQVRTLAWEDPGIKLTSPATPALADRFFTTSTTWEAPQIEKLKTKGRKKDRVRGRKGREEVGEERDRKERRERKKKEEMK